MPDYPELETHLPESVLGLRIALVHDWLTGMRGGEKVLEELVHLLGSRDLYTLVADPKQLSPTLRSCPIFTSFLQKLPGSPRQHQFWLPLYSRALEQFDFSEYDLVISTSHCVAHGIVTPVNTLHWCYVHTPMRYAWDMRRDYEESLNPILRPLFGEWMHRQRQWDVLAARRPDFLTANSSYVARRIQKHWGREASVIHPPVDLQRFELGDRREDYYFLLSALVPYKRVDLAMDACARLNRELVIAGDGPERKTLEAKARGTKTRFLGRVADKEIQKHYQSSKAFLFPGLEDFGITPLEAQACGTPVIAYGQGGALETVKHETTGVHFPKQSAQSMAAAIERLDHLSMDRFQLRAHATQFGTVWFRRHVVRSLVRCIETFEALRRGI